MLLVGSGHRPVSDPPSQHTAVRHDPHGGMHTLRWSPCLLRSRHMQNTNAVLLGTLDGHWTAKPSRGDHLHKVKGKAKLWHHSQPCHAATWMLLGKDVECTSNPWMDQDAHLSTECYIVEHVCTLERFTYDSKKFGDHIAQTKAAKWEVFVWESPHVNDQVILPIVCMEESATISPLLFTASAPRVTLKREKRLRIIFKDDVRYIG